jgi:hypothetical protein
VFTTHNASAHVLISQQICVPVLVPVEIKDFMIDGSALKPR